jgi:hypothetical protein
MKWYEVADDCGDGTTTRVRFRTREEAQAWRDKMDNDPDFQCDGDGSPVIEVDTESKWFYHDPEDDE